jgi:hypothetical protein
MLRLLYRWVLNAHPPYFRQRFSEEMLAIFDETGSRAAAAGLLADALVSLGRQWALRPQFWEEPAQAAGEGGALFSQLSDFRPRAIALFYGALMSAFVLNGISMTMGYIWEHPDSMDIGQPVVAPPGSWATRSEPLTATTTASTEPSLYTEVGRVLLVFNAPARTRSAAGRQGGSVSAAATVAKLDEDELAGTYRAYIGSYVSVSPDGTRINVAAESGRLQLDVAGKFRSALVASGQPNVWNCASGDCQAAFSTNAKGEVDRIKIRYAGRDLWAFRERSGMIF